MGLSGGGGGGSPVQQPAQVMPQVRYQAPTQGINQMQGTPFQNFGQQQNPAMGDRPDPMMLLQQLSQYQPRTPFEAQQLQGFRQKLIQSLQPPQQGLMPLNGMPQLPNGER